MIAPVFRLIKRVYPVTIMIGVLVLECSRGIDESVLERYVPVSVDILCMEKINELFRSATQYISYLRIWSGGAEKPCFGYIILVDVISMKAWIPTRRSHRIKDQGVSGIAHVSKKSIICRNGYTF